VGSDLLVQDPATAQGRELATGKAVAQVRAAVAVVLA
jgi:hypothetical protein